MNQRPALERVDLDEVVRALRDAGAVFAYLHGSAAAGAARPGSDVDIAACFGGRDPAPWSVPVAGVVDLVVLDRAPLALAGRVALNGKLLFDDDPPARVRWEATTRKIYLDERHRAQQAVADVAAGVRQAVARRSMVDAERLARVLTRIRQDLATLRRYADADRGELLADVVRLGHIKYLFVTLLEGCIDAAQHVCASEGYGPPDSNADAMHVLARNGILPDRLAETMADGVRFRNVLVHLYADVDDDRVVAHLDRLDDVERYVAALAGLLESDAAEGHAE